MFRKIISKIISFCIPELKPILNKTISLQSLRDIEENVNKSNFTKIYSPYRILNTTIGKGTYISLNSKISETIIGKFCSIGPNFVSGWGIHPTDGLSTSPFFYSTTKQNGGSIAKRDLIKERKPIVIGNDVFIGANVIVLDGVTIGDGAIIGAGTIVSKNVPDYAIVYGNPFTIKRYRFTEKQRTKLKNIAWWDFDDEKLKDVHDMFFNVDKFITKYDN
jgi:acetyltransferase-like isoleucine patch superfamily enzyme